MPENVPGGGGISYVRALDGLRAVALALVLLFHAEVPGFGGGFLGVSLFFTLSGYLITQLLLAERSRTGSIGLGGFWARRLRRLAPAAVTCLLVVAVLVAVTDLFPGPRVPGDVLAALADVANWRFALDEAGYSELFAGGPSPVLHFWSLAIEEQFYVLFPIAVAGLVALRCRRRGLAVVLAAGWVAGAAASVVADPDLAYYGTHTRAPELLAGALLALVLPIGRPVGERTRRAVAAFGVVALGALLVLSAVTTVASGWLYAGGLPAVSILWCAIVASATVPGPVSRVLGLAPAVAVGRRSYGMYVYHWPIFLVAAQLLPGWSPWALVPLEVLLTVAVAGASFAWLEEPIRSGRRPATAWRARPALLGAMALVLIAVLAVPVHDELRLPSGEGEEVGVVAFTGDDEPAVDLDVLVVGSESAVLGWVSRADVPGARITIRTGMRAGCPLTVPDVATDRCLPHAEAVQRGLDAGEPDLVVVAIGAGERAVLGGPGAPPADDPYASAAWGFERSREVLLVMLAGLPDVPTLFVDTGATPGDPLATVLSGYALLRRNAAVAATTDPAVVEDELVALAGLTDDHRRRLLVLGDSTSFELAQSLDDLAGRRYEVVWAGAMNCPLAVTTELRWQARLSFARDDCPSPAREWPEVVAAFRPEAVLGVWSIPELAEQRYPGDDRWHEPGEEAYVRAHDDVMAQLQELLAPSGAVTLVATSPPFADVPPGVTDFGAGPLGDPARLVGWTAQVHRWDATWRSVGVLDWARLVVDAEAAAAEPLRGDGLHLRPGAVQQWMAESLVAALDASFVAVQADATAGGCLTGIGADRVLVLDRCRAPG